MNKTKIITIICWCISALTLTGLALWFIFASPLFGSAGNRIFNFNWSVGGLETLSGPFSPVGTHTLAQNDFDSMSINWVSGTITIKPHDGNDIVITEFAQRELRDSEEMSVTTLGSTITINYIEGNRIGRMPSKRLEVLLPHALSGNFARLAVESTSGSMYISEVNAQTIDLNSTSGGFIVSNVNADIIHLVSTSGSIEVSDTSATELRTNATSGAQNISGSFDNADIRGISGRLTVNNSAAESTLNTSVTSGAQNISGSFSNADIRGISGAITLTSNIVPSSLRINTTSGNIDITVPNEGAISVRHSATSGRFTSAIPTITQSDQTQFHISTTSGHTTINELR